MPKFYGAIDLVKNELQNAVIQNLGSAPSSPTKGQMYFNSTDSILYWYNGSAWVPAMDTGAGALTPASTVQSETTFAKASAVGASLNYAREDHTHGSPTHDDAAHVAVHLNALAIPTGDINMNGKKITNLGMPAGNMDAATRQYVDDAVAGLHWKDKCTVATTANIVLSGLQSIDGVTLTAFDYVLVKNQTDPTQNGIWYPSSGAWTRRSDANTGTELEGAAVFVSQGTVNHDTAWVCTSDNIAVGTTPITWAQFGAGTVYVAGGGLTLTGNIFDVGAGQGIIVNPDSVAIDPGTVMTWNQFIPYGYAAKKSFDLVGTASPEVINHNFGNRDLHLAVYNTASPYNAVQVDWEMTTTNTITIRYNPNLGAGYRAVVIG